MRKENAYQLIDRCIYINEPQKMKVLMSTFGTHQNIFEEDTISKSKKKVSKVLEILFVKRIIINDDPEHHWLID